MIRLIKLLTLSVLAAQALLFSQAPVSNAVRAGKVWISGENPGIRLLDKEGGETLSRASFWRVHWSPYGPGHVCLITTGDGKGPGNIRIALYDNARLFEYLTKEMLGSFDKTYAEQPFKPIGGAKFGVTGDSLSERRERCEGGNYKIELVWRDFQTASVRDTMVGSRPQNPFGLTYLRIPARAAEIIINGKKAAGLTYPIAPGDSSSFLAFGETWLK
jgi:hypothetical protein